MPLNLTSEKSLSVHLLLALLVAATLQLSCIRVYAQNLTGELDGVVRDTTGAVIPDASVTVVDGQTHLVARTLLTDAQGQFIVPSLATGDYNLTVRARGFAKVTLSQIAVNVNSKTPIHIELSPGSVTSSIVVSEANTVVADTQSAASATLINGTQMRQLSLSNRNFEQLLTLQPGVTGQIPGAAERGPVDANGSANSTASAVNGQRGNQNGFYLDGADILDHSAGTQVSIFPSVDALQEMNLIHSNYGAQYGGMGSGLFSLQTRQGTSTFHGGAYYFFRSQVLDANTYLNNLGGIARPGMRYGDFGEDIGGPIWIQHLELARVKRTP